MLRRGASGTDSLATATSQEERPKSNLRRSRASTKQRRKRRTLGAKADTGSSATCQFFCSFLAALTVFLLVDLAYLYSLTNDLSWIFPTYRADFTLASKLGTHETDIWHAQEDYVPHFAKDQRPPIQDHPDLMEKVEKYNQAANDRHQETIDPIQDREPILEILRQSGVNLTYDHDAEIIKALPTWSTVERIYGRELKVLGLERCQEFREKTDPVNKFYGIAGTFNSGTNLMSQLLTQNCQITERMLAVGNESKGMRWQVPWGKHYPAYRRGSHSTRTDKEIAVENSLPIVTIRDPYSWSQSMCRHKYAANWTHRPDHCPNLVVDETDVQVFGHAIREHELVPVTVRYAKDFRTHHDSLFHMWNEWYQLYYNVSYPRLIVRFEDLLFRAKELTEIVCACGGGVPREDKTGFEHISESAKLGTAAHGRHKTNLLGALMKYGTDEHRLDRFTKEDLQQAEKILDRKLMDLFGYPYPKI